MQDNRYMNHYTNRFITVTIPLGLTKRFYDLGCNKTFEQFVEDALEKELCYFESVEERYKSELNGTGT